MASTPGPVLPPSSQELCSGLPLCPLSREEGQHSWVAGVLFEGKVRVQRSPALPEPRDTGMGVFLTLPALCQTLTRLMPWEDSVLHGECFCPLRG